MPLRLNRGSNTFGALTDSGQSTPLSPGEYPFLGTDGVGIGGGGGEVGMAEPFLHQVERDAGRDRRHPEVMPQPFG